MSRTEMPNIERDILRAAQHDYLDVWFITILVQSALGVEDESEALNTAIDAIERLLRAGELRAGELVPPGEFVPWAGDAETAIARIHVYLGELKGPPNVGEVAWFDTPEGTPT